MNRIGRLHPNDFSTAARFQAAAPADVHHDSEGPGVEGALSAEASGSPAPIKPAPESDLKEQRADRALANILLVDDDRLVRISMSRALQEEGYAVSVAGDSDEAIRLAMADPPPDLIILDIRIPGVGGLGVAKHLNEQTEVPFVILSAFGEHDLVEQASAAGALAYLVKPLDPAQFIPAIRAALDRAREIKKLRQAAKAMRGALDDRELSAMVVGVLMERFALDRDAAFDLLRSQARRERRKVRDLAEELLLSSERMNRLAAAVSRKESKDK